MDSDAINIRVGEGAAIGQDQAAGKPEGKEQGGDIFDSEQEPTSGSAGVLAGHETGDGRETLDADSHNGHHRVVVLIECKCGANIVNPEGGAVAAALNGAGLVQRCSSCGTQNVTRRLPSDPMFSSKNLPNRKARRAAAKIVTP